MRILNLDKFNLFQILIFVYSKRGGNVNCVQYISLHLTESPLQTTHLHQKPTPHSVSSTSSAALSAWPATWPSSDTSSLALTKTYPHVSTYVPPLTMLLSPSWSYLLQLPSLTTEIRPCSRMKGCVCVGGSCIDLSRGWQCF